MVKYSWRENAKGGLRIIPDKSYGLCDISGIVLYSGFEGFSGREEYEQ
jgi:hypothetical protein